MALEKIVDSALSMARLLKERDQAAPLDPFLLAFRGGRPMAMVVFDGAAAEVEVMDAFALAAWGFDADAQVLVDDEWGTIVAIATNRADDHLAMKQTYRLSRQGLSWGDPTDTDAAPRVWEMVRAMGEPSSFVETVGRVFANRATRDLWTTEQIQAAAPCLVVLGSAEADEERIQTLRGYGAIPATVRTEPGTAILSEELGYYEDDEPVDRIRAIFEAGEKGLTER